MALRKKYKTYVIWSASLGDTLNAVSETYNGDFEVVFITDQIAGGVLHVTVSFWEEYDNDPFAETRDDDLLRNTPPRLEEE